MRFLAPAVVSLFLSGYLAAAEPMSAHTVTALMTNNTMNGKNLDKNREFTDYFRDGGTSAKLTSKGNTW
jgi:hypothetical protein